MAQMLDKRASSQRLHNTPHLFRREPFAPWFVQAVVRKEDVEAVRAVAITLGSDRGRPRSRGRLCCYRAIGSSSKEVRAIGCGRPPTGEQGFGATLTHDTNSGKAAEAEKVGRSTLARPT